jgi:hypothetical protein
VSLVTGDALAVVAGGLTFAFACCVVCWPEGWSFWRAMTRNGTNE